MFLYIDSNSIAREKVSSTQYQKKLELFHLTVHSCICLEMFKYTQNLKHRYIKKDDSDSTNISMNFVACLILS